MTGACTDLAEDILGILRRRSHGCMTYYVANVLKMSPRDGELHTRRSGITTTEVRREMQRLEKAGKVKRIGSIYQRHLCWVLA